MFGEIRRNEQLPGRIASEITRQISEGSLLPGQKLPTEHNLAQSFGVSRSVVREAIAQLRNEGLVETRQGVGAFVTEPDKRHAIRIEPETLANRDSFRSLFQLRMALEIEAAGLAAVHHDENDMMQLNEALAEMSGSKSGLTRVLLLIWHFTVHSRLQHITNIFRWSSVSLPNASIRQSTLLVLAQCLSRS